MGVSQVEGRSLSEFAIIGVIRLSSDILVNQLHCPQVALFCRLQYLLITKQAAFFLEAFYKCGIGIAHLLCPSEELFRLAQRASIR